MKNHRFVPSSFRSWFSLSSLENLILVGGIAIAIVQFLFNRCLWADSARIAMNIAERGFIGLLKPLDYFQSAPVGFLWCVRFMWILFPNCDWSLKLFPLLFHVLSLLMISLILRMTISNPTARCFSLFLYVTAIGPLYFSSEVKQYIADEFAAACLLWLAIRCTTRSQLLLLGITGLAFIPLSNAVFFLLPSIGLFLLMSLPPESSKDMFPYLVISGLLWAAGLLCFTILFTDESLKNYMIRYWSHADPAFLFRQGSWKLSLFTIVRQTCGTMAIMFGSFPSMIVASVLIPLGVIRFLRQKHWNLVLLLVFPVLMHGLASLLKQYPFAPRMLLHAFPCMLVLFAAGIEALFDSLPKTAITLLVALSSCQAGVLSSSFPLRRHETMETVRKLYRRYETDAPIVIDGSASWNWRFYSTHSRTFPALLARNAKEVPDNGNSCAFSKCPSIVSDKWWLLLGFSSSINIIPDVVVNRPLYWLFRVRNPKKDSTGHSFQEMEAAVNLHLKTVHGYEVRDSIHDAGSSALLLQKTRE